MTTGQESETEFRSAEALHRFEGALMLGQTATYLAASGGLFHAALNLSAKTPHLVTKAVPVVGVLLSVGAECPWSQEAIERARRSPWLPSLPPRIQGGTGPPHGVRGHRGGTIDRRADVGRGASAGDLGFLDVGMVLRRLNGISYSECQP